MTDTLEVIGKLKKAQAYLNAHVFERERETEGILLALLAGSSCLFIGDPGTGKTHHIRMACSLLGLDVFDTLISETTKPDTIFGPTDVPALAKGIQRTKIQGYAPASEVLFFDEIFKASGIVLNPMLWLINEHQYRNGDEGIIKCPIKAVFAASNEIPTDSGLKPVYDRFLLRYHVKYLRSKENLAKMLESNGAPKVKQMLSREEILYLRKCVKVVEIPPEVRECVFDLRDQITRAVGVTISDRRLVKSFRLLQARALLKGRRVVGIKDTEILANLFWENLDQIRKVRSIVLNVSSASLSDLVCYEEIAEELWQKCLKTGNMDEATERLTAMYVTARRFSTDAGKEVAQNIQDYLKRVKAIQSKRNEFVVVELVDADGSRRFKLSAACESLWSTKQLRSVDFKWYRKGAYWWQPAVGKKSTRESRNKARRRLAAKIVKKLGVNLTLTKMA